MSWRRSYTHPIRYLEENLRRYSVLRIDYLMPGNRYVQQSCNFRYRSDCHSQRGVLSRSGTDNPCYVTTTYTLVLSLSPVPFARLPLSCCTATSGAEAQSANERLASAATQTAAMLSLDLKFQSTASKSYAKRIETQVKTIEAR